MKPTVLLGTLRGSERLAASILETVDCEVLCLHGAVADALQRIGIPAASLDDYLSEDIRRQVIAEAERRLAVVQQSFESPTFRAAYPGLSDAGWAKAAAITSQGLSRDMGEVILLTELIRRAALRRDIRLLVVQEDYGRDTRTAIQTCRRYGIPSLHILHGIPYQTQAGHDVFEADIVAAQGERARDVLVALGHEPDRIVLTGGLEWDRFSAPLTPLVKTEACQILGLDPARPVVGYAATFTHGFSAVSVRHPAYHDATSRAVIDAFAAAQKEHGDWQFVLRAHPGDSGGRARLEAMAREAGLSGAVSNDGDTYSFLASLDSLLCVQSNIGVEGLLLGLPVVNVAIDAFAKAVFNEGVGSLFRDGDPIHWARSVDAIGPAIDEAMRSEPTAHRDLSAFTVANDGHSLHRITELIVSMMEAPERFVPSGNVRLPEFENALAMAIPSDTGRVAVLGARADFVAAAIARLLPRCERATGDGPVDAVVLTDPLPHDATAEIPLREARERIGDSGAIIACGYHGACTEAKDILHAGLWGAESRSDVPLTSAGQFSQRGLEILLSRVDLEPGCFVPVYPTGARRAVRLGEQCEAFAVCARIRVPAPSALAVDRQEKRERAIALNEQGEARFVAGDIVGAMELFAQAIGLCPPLAVAHNNLGTGLAALGRAEEAYDRVRDALHFDPGLRSARDNLRELGDVVGLHAETERLLRIFGTDQEDA